jgi:uncharacterized lipoprotein YddW (UPF0748 family)
VENRQINLIYVQTVFMAKIWLLLLSISFVLTSCFSSQKVQTPGKIIDNQPKTEREFRAAWIATVANINWPSRPGLPVDSQKLEALALLDYLKDHNFNAAILQVRPHGDALYKSDLEPWSYYLTGEQGKAPSPYYDPLEFWVEEAHDRGIELHVWLNPYRAHHKDGGVVGPTSIVMKHPEMVVYLKEGYWWMDPSLQSTQDLTANVVKDLVNRYDIDGIHMDDYFYPYPSYNLGEDFPDTASWNAYLKGGGTLSRGDWRRQSVNTLIERLYKEVRAGKPWVKFGLSPFGIWRPGYPESVEGFDQYEQLYADAKLWLNKGWVDYFAPQLYWKISRIPQSYPVLLGWWQSENTMQRHLWPGINVGRDTSIRTVEETLNQIMIARGMLPESKGVIHWSISSDVKNTRLASALNETVYKKDALVPASPWMDDVRPLSPAVHSQVIQDSAIKISWTPADEKDAFRFVIASRYGNNWNYEIMNRKERSLIIGRWKMTGKTKTFLQEVFVKTVDRTGNESEARYAVVEQ